MSDHFPTFETFLKRSGRRTWRWRLCTTEGRLVMQGSEIGRPAAKYAAERALFLMLLSAASSSVNRAARTDLPPIDDAAVRDRVPQHRVRK